MKVFRKHSLILVLLNSRYRRFQSLCVGHTYCHARSRPQSRSLDVSLCPRSPRPPFPFLLPLTPLPPVTLSGDRLTGRIHFPFVKSAFASIIACEVILIGLWFGDHGNVSPSLLIQSLITACFIHLPLPFFLFVKGDTDLGL